MYPRFSNFDYFCECRNCNAHMTSSNATGERYFLVLALSVLSIEDEILKKKIHWDDIINKYVTIKSNKIVL